MIFTTNLLFYHTKLVTGNMTTKEELKNYFKNPFGNIYQRNIKINWKNVIFPLINKKSILDILKSESKEEREIEKKNEKKIKRDSVEYRRNQSKKKLPFYREEEEEKKSKDEENNLRHSSNINRFNSKDEIINNEINIELTNRNTENNVTTNNNNIISSINNNITNNNIISSNNNNVITTNNNIITSNNNIGNNNQISHTSSMEENYENIDDSFSDVQNRKIPQFPYRIDMSKNFRNND